MKIIYSTLVLLLLFTFKLQAQLKTDSLENKLKLHYRNDTGTVNLLKELCRGYIDLNNKKLAQYAKEMLSISEKINYTKGKADALNFLGIVKDIDSDYAKALIYYSEALVFAKQVNAVQTIASIANNIGLIAWKTGDFKKAISSFFEGLKQAEALNNIKMQANISSNIGLVFQDLKRHNEGLQWQQKALVLRLKKKDNYGLASTYGNLASAYSFLHKSDSSIYYQKKAIRLQQELQDEYGLGISYLNLGAEYKNLNNNEEALKYFMLSKFIREKMGDDLGLSFTYMSMAMVYKNQHKYTDAITYGEKALAIACKIKSDPRISETSNGLSQIYRSAGKTEKALDMMQQYIQYHEKVFNQEMNKKVSELHILYQTEEKQNQLNKSKLLLIRKENQARIQNLWLFGVAVTAVFILFASIYVYRQQRRQHQLKTKIFKIDNENKLNEQRLEISRDLHDSMGAQLTFISSILDGLKSSPTKFDQVANDKIQRLSEFSENSITELKNTLWVLNTKEINLDDLKAKILNFIKNASEAKEDLKFSFNFKISENFNLNSKQAVNLFRTVQEIVNNAIKYAQASEIKIEVQQNDKNLKIKIADNGNGFDYEKEKNKSFGLTNIQNRIADINGTINIETAAGKGTDYSIQIDL